MALLGKLNQLSVLREATPGLYLDGGSHGDILLPRRYVPDDAMPESTLEVFVYRDSEDRLVATTEHPHAMVGDFAFLQVVSADRQLGAFLDWGLPKDLLLPRREQTFPVRAGMWLVVHVSLDEKSDRIVASARWKQALRHDPPAYSPYHPVSLLVAAETPLGYTAIIENKYSGMLYRTDLSRPLEIGQRLDGFVRTVREDGKLDLALDRSGFQRIAPLKETIVAALVAAGGRLPYHDKTPPEEIREAFGVSKKAFKQALGTLYHDRRISLEPSEIRLVENDRPEKRSSDRGKGK